MFTAIIPIRKGSKRIKNKNLRIINNLPLYQHIVNTTLKCKKISKVIISTDIKKIMVHYKNHKKITIKKRKKSLAGNCNMNLVIKDIIEDLDEKLYVQLHATSPFLNNISLDKHLSNFLSQSKYDSFFSVNKFAKRLWKNAKTPFNHILHSEPTTQNLQILYEENSAFYIFTKKSFFKNDNRIGNKPKMIELNKIESFDIDEESDLNFIKYVQKNK